MAVGTALGAASASRTAPAPTTVVIQQPAGGSPPLPLGTRMSSLPGACVSTPVGTAQYYQCGANWFLAFFGSTGAYYQVVQAP